MLEAGWPGEGVAFGLPFQSYLDAGGLSFSLAKSAITPLDVWTRLPANPHREVEEPSFHKELGAAYHARICEGREAFAERFVADLDPADYPDALRTNDELKAELVRLGVKPPTTKAAMIEALEAAGYQGQIWQRLREEFDRKNAGKVFLEAKQIERIEWAAAMIERHPHLAPVFRGGFSEVSIFWREPESGCPMKARLDKLHMKAIVDLKSFSNPYGKTFEREVAYAIAARKYYLQAAIYIDAVRAARRMWREKSGFYIAGEGAAHPNPDWLDQWAAIEDDPAFIFVFQQTGVAPVARGYRMPRGNVLSIGAIEYAEIARRVMEWSRAYGDDPWVDDAPIVELQDLDFPAFLGR